MYNILFIESGTTGGGSFESLYQHLEVIDQSRFRPVVLFLNPNRFFPLIERMGIKVYLVHDLLYSRGSPLPLFFQKGLIKISFWLAKYCEICSLFYLRLAHQSLVLRIKEIVRKEQIDLLYLNDQIDRDMFGVFAVEKVGIPCVSHLRSMDGANFSGRKAKIANSFISAYISNSQSTKRYWESRGIEARKSFLVYNAIKPFNKDERDTGQYNFRSGDQFLVGSIGRLITLKGYSFLLRAFKLFQDKHLDAKLIIIGDGPLKGRLEREARKLGIAEQVWLAGYIENAKYLIGQFDLFVLPSRYDAFGRVLLEAMQQEVPVIGTDLYGIAEIIEHENNGLLVPYNDDKALRNAMERILTNDVLRKKFVENALKTVNEQFNIDNYKQNIENILSTVLAN